MGEVGHTLALMFKPIKSAKEFLTALWDIWGALMSGAFSVPFAAAAIFADSRYGSLIWSAMAYAALAFSAFLLWRRTVALEVRLRPKLRCSFDERDALCKRPVTTQSGPGQWYRIKVEATTDAPASRCSAVLLDIFRGDVPIVHGELPRLMFALSTDPLDKTIYPQTPAVIDLMVITESNEAHLALSTPDGMGSIDMTKVFSEAGDYTIRIAVNSSDAGRAAGKLLFQWRKDCKTAKLTWQGDA
jgi:hypothetical protein